jgi:hypothetical protein
MPTWGFRHDPEGSFWSKVDRSNGSESCWEWTAAADPSGYGALKVGRKKVNAHRYSLELKLGRPLQPGMDACHTCGNRLCVNPSHLYEGTRKQNVADAIAAGTHALDFGTNPPKGTRHGSNILSEQAVLSIYTRAWAGERLVDLATEYGVRKETISEIKQGRNWGWLTKHKKQG